MSILVMMLSQWAAKSRRLHPAKSGHSLEGHSDLFRASRTTQTEPTEHGRFDTETSVGEVMVGMPRRTSVVDQDLPIRWPCRRPLSDLASTVETAPAVRLLLVPGGRRCGAALATENGRT